MPVSSIPARLITAQGAAPSYAARAWVNFNGTGTVAIRASGNVSSITDNGIGDYTVNFTTAMPDENYCAVQSTSRGDVNTGLGAVNRVDTVNVPTNSYYRFQSGVLDGNRNFQTEDVERAHIAIFR